MPKGIRSTEPKRLTFNAFVLGYAGDSHAVLDVQKTFEPRKGRVTERTCAERYAQTEIWKQYVAAGGGK